jgi:hypothetical protein
MGHAAWERRFEAGEKSMYEKDGEYRIDMPLENWEQIRWLAHRGFKHSMPNYTGPALIQFSSKDEAERAERAIEKLEFSIHHSKVDPDYFDSQSRLQLIWELWPRE